METGQAGGYPHVTVLLREAVDALRVRPDGTYLDGTLGLGGHSEEIARRLGPAGRLIAVDQDPMALETAARRLAPYGARVTLVRGNFRELDRILAAQGLARVDGMLFDLGVSSPQLDRPERGFSYLADAPLDMRMDPDGPLTARQVVNGWPEAELRRIIRDYGEERYAARIAAAIARRRAEAPITGTLELAELVRAAMPAPARREKQHPAKRSFQAIRIAVNDELGAVEALMDRAPELLAPGGRIAVISFHSLESRIVKRAVAARENGCTCPPDFPVCVCGFRQTLRTVEKLTPSPAEIAANPRARSAILRVAERVDGAE